MKLTIYFHKFLIQHKIGTTLPKHLCVMHETNKLGIGIHGARHYWTMTMDCL